MQGGPTRPLPVCSHVGPPCHVHVKDHPPCSNGRTLPNATCLARPARSIHRLYMHWQDPSGVRMHLS